MASHSRLDVYNAILNSGVMPIFYYPDIEIAKKVVDACVAGGIRTMEFTNRGDFALDTYRDLRHYIRQTHPDLIFGAGTLIEEATAAMYIAAGADFLVSPNWNPAVAKLCNRRRIPYLPGCGSVSEISDAEELGVELIKLFPADVYGPGFVKAIKGPMPGTRILATGGVDATEDSIKTWFQAGVSGVGMGSALLVKSDIASENYAAITQRCKDVIAWVQQYKS